MNIDIGTAYETITWDEVKDLPVFGGDTGMFDVGYRALFIPLLARTREQILEYAWDNKRAPIIETVNNKGDGVTTFEFRMFKIED